MTTLIPASQLVFPGRANHWSAIIGGSHSKNYVLWEYGGYASEGVKQVAELGSPVKMEEEIRQQVRKAITEWLKTRNAIKATFRFLSQSVKFIVQCARRSVPKKAKSVCWVWKGLCWGHRQQSPSYCLSSSLTAFVFPSMCAKSCCCGYIAMSLVSWESVWWILVCLLWSLRGWGSDIQIV